MNSNELISAFNQLGRTLQSDIKTGKLDSLIYRAYRHNGWFTPAFITESIEAITNWLDKESLEKWLSPYQIKNQKVNTGLILAGNIPLVGFHDFLCVLMSGNKALIKCSKDDNVLLPAIIEMLYDLDSAFHPLITLADKLENADAVIATGSNNSARYFEYYFGKLPHIIRKNRNSIAVLTGNESTEELIALGQDIFSYYGLGCRNVSKLYIPEDYSFDNFFKAIEKYAEVMNHNKYMNNYDYYNAVYLLNGETFLTNNFLIVKENEMLATPVSVLHFERYKNIQEFENRITLQKDQIQCIVGNNYLPFGMSQRPLLNDYADRVDTMQFLCNL
jgi:hypothetical protein